MASVSGGQASWICIAADDDDGLDDTLMLEENIGKVNPPGQLDAKPGVLVGLKLEFSEGSQSPASLKRGCCGYLSTRSMPNLASTAVLTGVLV